jgi:hydrogenase nickel incorporation protein HypA/HybF
MHEVSIALNLIELAETAAKEAGASNILAVHLRLGVFSGVVKESLHFAFDVAKENSLLAGARLIIEEVPLRIFCSHCKAERELENVYYLACPVCGMPSLEIREGKEIELSFLEAADETEIA